LYDDQKYVSMKIQLNKAQLHGMTASHTVEAVVFFYAESVVYKTIV